MWTRNIKDYEVECAAIPRDRLVQVLTTEMNYDPWGGSDEHDVIDWKKLGAAAKKKPIKVAHGKNKWHLDNLDLGAVCGSAAGSRGVYLADVRSTVAVWNARRNLRQHLPDVTAAWEKAVAQ